MPMVPIDPNAGVTDLIPVDADPTGDIALGVQAAVDKFAEILDRVNAPTTAIVNGNVQQLTPEGRILKIADERDQARADVIAKLTNQPDPDAIIKAKNLLSESFKWLTGFDQTADLRQRIILFMEQK